MQIPHICHGLDLYSTSHYGLRATVAKNNVLLLRVNLYKIPVEAHFPIALNDTSYMLRQRCTTDFYLNLENVVKKESWYINTPTLFRWWQHFKEGNIKVVDEA